MEKISLADYLSALNSLNGFQDWDPAVIEVFARLGLIDQLEKSATPEAVEVLQKVCLQSTYKDVQNRAIEGLTALALKLNQAAVQALFHLAVLEDYTLAQLFLADHLDVLGESSQKAWILFISSEFKQLAQLDPQLIHLTEGLVDLPGSPPSALQEKFHRLGRDAGFQEWLLLADFLLEPNEENAARLTAAYPRFHPTIQDLAFHWLAQFAEMDSRAAQAAVCDLFIDYAHAAAREIALERRWFPAHPQRLALFLFLTEQWPLYNELDFDNSLLTTAFSTASDSLKQRLLSLSRYTGQIEWLNTQPGRLNSRIADELTSSDWQYIIRELKKANRWPELFALLAVAPPVWSAEILLHLSESAYNPSEPSLDWEKLIKLARQCQASGFPHPELDSEEFLPSTNCLAFSVSAENILAVSSPDGIDIWDISTGLQLKAQIRPPALPARTIALSPDGLFVAAGGGDNRIRIFRLSDRQIIKTLDSHTAPIQSLTVLADNRTLLSASQDGALRTWRFPLGQMLGEAGSGKNVEMLHCLAAKKDQLALASFSNGDIRVFTLPSLQPGQPLSNPTKPTSPARLAAASKRGELFAIVDSSQQINIWNLSSQKLVHAFSTSEYPLTLLAFDNTEETLISGDRDGKIILWDVHSGQVLSQAASRLASPVIAAFQLQNEQFLGSLTAGGCYSKWNTALVQLSNTALRKVNQTTLTTNMSSLPRELSECSRNWRAFIQALVEWQHRFDIHIGEIHSVSTGEFDIQL